ncbi:AbrB/MazE/SpoVT family DNA-binding domain-containing protein [Svornostia abyssi]|uniref:AbrB/MazE/SpoVT family DNA-binding domain-containing protein n=1 Tax=Svornostia abyssi TaxID=2898438 RepID=A0ABY5PJD6_9ACTN|nr:AbrB/MazE/SpoVT family DNA-binding domain-containing protein [Parviterribacteraceae bacterium J379]
MGDAQMIQADGRGRVLLPKALRDRLGLGPHAKVAVEEADDGSVVLRDPAAARRRTLDAMQGSLAHAPGSVDDFLAQRHRDAAAED